MSESQRPDATLAAYRADWREIARYTVRFKGLYFSGQSHMRRVIATDVAWAELDKIRAEQSARMETEGVRGHILIDLERPEETRAQFKRERLAREAREPQV